MHTGAGRRSFWGSRALLPSASSLSNRQAMPHAQLTESVRRLVANTFAPSAADGCPVMRESILIRGGAYCGRRFETARGHAVWFVEENQVKFYRADGRVVHVLDVPLAEAHRLRVAA